MTTAASIAAPKTGGIAQPILAGILASVVGYASSFPLVLAAFAAGGATPGQAGAGLLVTTAAVGLLNLAISWRSRMPLSFAWSTPGAAPLASSTWRTYFGNFTSCVPFLYSPRALESDTRAAGSSSG